MLFYQRSIYCARVWRYDRPDVVGGGETIKAGDIVSLYPEQVCTATGLGKEEKKHVFMIRLFDMDDSVLDQMSDPHEDGATWFEKRRYCIPFKRLAQVYPDFDPNLAASLDYHPFIPIDEEITGRVSGSEADAIRLATGWYRLSPGVPIACDPSTFTVSLTNLPPGFTYDVPLQSKAFAKTPSLVKELGGVRQFAHKFVQNEDKVTMKDGVLVRIIDQDGKSADTTFNWVLDYMEAGMGEPLAKVPPFSVRGLVYDKAIGGYF